MNYQNHLLHTVFVNNFQMQVFEPFIFVKAVIQAVEVIHCAVLTVNNSDEGDDFIAVIAESKQTENEVT